ncbi:MAG: TraX family protein [Lachnospiraceae bacterium]|nr:TraX family protein [Lachnospiraceae bacterium]
MFFYNGKSGKKSTVFSKWFFYVFYPVHLLILGILRLVL